MKHPVTWLNDKLEGWPSSWLTWLLIGVALFAVVVAIKGKPVTKALVAAWMIAP